MPSDSLQYDAACDTQQYQDDDIHRLDRSLVQLHSLNRKENKWHLHTLSERPRQALVCYTR